MMGTAAGMISRGGYKIYSVEVENVLSGRL
jgi:hypothetical protein